MTLPAVHLLFLLFSMLPLLQASPCPRGEYCPEGADCRADKNLCLPATCDNGANRTLCDRGTKLLSNFCFKCEVENI